MVTLGARVLARFGHAFRLRGVCPVLLSLSGRFRGARVVRGGLLSLSVLLPIMQSKTEIFGFFQKKYLFIFINIYARDSGAVWRSGLMLFCVAALVRF